MSTQDDKELKRLEEEIANAVDPKETLGNDGTTTLEDLLKKMQENENGPAYKNAPDNLKDALERLAKAELLLEDLARGAELAEITKNVELSKVFREAAEEYLVGKMYIEDPRFKTEE